MPNIGGFISGALSSPLTAILEAANGIIGKFVVDPEAKLNAATELMRAEQAFRVELLHADTSLAEQQAKIITSEADSQSWMARNWRPILMLTFTFIVAWNYVIASLFRVPKTEIPPDMWDLLKLGITGYIIGRSAEKIAPTVADAIIAKRDA